MINFFKGYLDLRNVLLIIFLIVLTIIFNNYSVLLGGVTGFIIRSFIDWKNTKKRIK